MRAFGQIDARDEVFVAAEHHHHDQAGDQGQVDQRQHGQHQIRFRHVWQMRRHVPEFLEKLYTQREDRERQSKVDRRQNPATGEQHFFKSVFE